MAWTADSRLVPAISLAFLLCACAERHGQAGGEAQAGTVVPPAVSGSGNAGASAMAAGGAAVRPTSSGKPAKIGASASAKLESLDPLGPDGELPLRGEVTFRVSDAGVDMTMSIRSCTTRRKYGIYILEGGDCSSATLLGERWDSPRGEGITEFECGTSGFGKVLHMRSAKDPNPWTIEGPAASDLIGHAVAIYLGDHPAACGVIMRDESAPADDLGEQVAGVPLELRAQVAGLCLGRSIVRDNAQECPNPKELYECSRAHCDVDQCVKTCAESGYLDCLQQKGGDDLCSAEPICQIDEKCADCQSKLSTCTFNFCPEKIACAAPVSPDGPCSQLEACCAMQGEMAAMCLDLVQMIAKFSGDPSCYGIQHDWDFFSHLPVPCKFE